jgi:hypothetical protein
LSSTVIEETGSLRERGTGGGVENILGEY